MALVVLLWIAFAWESSTGLTFASRNNPGRVSTATHLAETKRIATGATLICVPLAMVYFLFLRPKD